MKIFKIGLMLLFILVLFGGMSNSFAVDANDLNSTAESSNNNNQKLDFVVDIGGIHTYERQIVD